jgi:hypothetical protein
MDRENKGNKVTARELIHLPMIISTSSSPFSKLDGYTGHGSVLALAGPGPPLDIRIGELCVDIDLRGM